MSPPEIVPVLRDAVRIWDAAPHSAFTDLARFRDGWFCVFREAERHVHGRDGRIRVLASPDGSSWESAALLSEEGVDLRDPKLSVTPDGRLMLLAGGSVYADEKLVTRRPRVAFSADGRAWSAPTPVLSEGEWLWRVTWHSGRAYGVSYAASETAWTLKLFASDDGLHYELVCDLDVPGRPTETTLRFLPDESLMALVRRDGDDREAWIGTSRAPYTDWSWHASGHRVGGPDFVVVPGKGIWAAGRDYRDGTTTVLARLDAERYEPVLTLPSGGDTSYPGLVWHEGLLWTSYYSSHEGKASIYLARIELRGP